MFRIWQTTLGINMEPNRDSRLTKQHFWNKQNHIKYLKLRFSPVLWAKLLSTLKYLSCSWNVPSCSWLETIGEVDLRICWPKLLIVGNNLAMYSLFWSMNNSFYQHQKQGLCGRWSAGTMFILLKSGKSLKALCYCARGSECTKKQKLEGDL